MATRVQIDANGLRVSKPGFDANGGREGLLFDTAIRYGQLLDHQIINLERVKYSGPNAAYGAAISEGIVGCNGTFYYGPYAEKPDVICVGIVNGRYEFPPVEYNGTASTAKWIMDVRPQPGSCQVFFDRATGQAGYAPIMPHQAMLLVFRKPRFS